MKIQLTGTYSNRPQIMSIEDAIDVLRDCEEHERISAAELRRRFEAGITVEQGWFTAVPIPDDDVSTPPVTVP